MGRVTLPAASVGTLLTLLAGVAGAFTRGCERGSEGADKMLGTAADDLLRGEGGNDGISGNAGEDTLVGGSENDTIDGGEGNDKIKGGTGRDAIRAGAGDDVVRGGMHDRANDGARDVLDCGDGTVYRADVVRDSCEIKKPSE